MEQAIYYILANDAAVKAIVVARIYPFEIPQDVILPAIVYGRVSTMPTDTKDGVSKLDSVIVDIDLFGENFKILSDLADKTRAALDRKSGTYSSQNIDSIIFTDQRNIYEEVGEVFHITQSYRIRKKN